MAPARPLLLLFPALLYGCGGDAPVDPPVPTTVTVTPSEVSFASVGDTELLSARVFDQHGSAMANVRVQWASIDPGVASVRLSSGRVTSAGNGATTITARAGGATGQASATVQQVPTGIEPARGDGQEGFFDEPLPVPPAARVLDANGNPARDIAVAFEVTSGGGTIAEAIVVTGTDGTAETTWTLGSDPVQTLSATTAGMTADFTVTAIRRPVTILVDSLEWGRATVAYETLLEARGGTSEGYLWSLGEGAALPEGLELSADGMIHGTPAESGEFEFTVRVADSGGEEASADLGLHLCDGPLGLAVGDARTLEPAQVGPCGVFVRAPEASAYYRVTFAGQNAVTEQLLNVELVVEGISSGEAAFKPVAAGRAPAPGLPRQVVDRTRDLEIQAANDALHSRIRQAEIELFRRLADEGRLGAMLKRGIDAQEARRRTQARSSAPHTFRLFNRSASDLCAVDTTVVADVIAQNDHLTVYEEVGAASPASVDDVNRVLDFYADHGAEVIENYFGGVSDVNNDSRITVLIDPTLTGVRAFVWAGDMSLTAADCASSNEMELIHVSAGAFRLEYSFWVLSGMVHEAKHVSSLYKRVRNYDIRGRPSGERTFNPRWVEEGTAEIAKEMSSRLAWERAGGPTRATRVTGDMMYQGLDDSEEEVYGTFQVMGRVVRAFSAIPNAVTFEPRGAGHVYGSGWHFHRLLRDRMIAAAADDAQSADEAFVTALNDSLTEPGIQGIAAVTGESLADLLLAHAHAMTVAGAESRVTGDTAPTFLSYDFPTATEIFTNPDPLGRYPWPVTISGRNDSNSESAVDLANSRRFLGQVASSGVRMYDFEASAAGAAAVFHVLAGPGVRMIIARVPKPPGFQ